MSALTERHPRAYRFSRFLMQSAIFFMYTAAFGPVLIVLGILIAMPISSDEIMKLFADLGCILTFGSLALAGLLYVVRFAVVAACFARYSLLDLLGVILPINCLTSLYIILPESFRAIPVIIGAWAIVAIIFYVSCQGPETVSGDAGQSAEQ